VNKTRAEEDDEKGGDPQVWNMHVGFAHCRWFSTCAASKIAGKNDGTKTAKHESSSLEFFPIVDLA
jgi:hypothetical protein